MLNSWKSIVQSTDVDNFFCDDLRILSEIVRVHCFLKGPDASFPELSKHMRRESPFCDATIACEYWLEVSNVICGGRVKKKRN